MVFLYRPAAVTGLQTTVGLLQGKFSVVGDELVNGVNNVNVFHEVHIDPSRLNTQEEQLLRNPAALKADAFVGMVRRAVEDRWIQKGVMSRAQ
jgi:hypothetical protein